MLTEKQIQDYRTNGYLHLKGIYSLEEVQRARALIENDIQTGGWTSAPHYNEGVTTDIYERIPELATIVFNDNFLQAMADLFQPEPVILAEPAVHKSRYYYWHKDSTFIDEQGDDYHWKDDFQAAMTVQYLQANHPEEGGGITVIPRSHKQPDFYHRIPQMNLFQRAILKAQKILGISHFDRMDKHKQLIELPSQIGDLLVLDMRLDHKGTPARKKASITKYGIMNIACSGKETAKKLRVSLRNRSSDYYQKYLNQEGWSSPVLKQVEKQFDDPLTIWL